MEINYKGVLCRLGTYRVIGEDKPTLYFISAPDDETMYKAGFKELHYGLWGKILTDEEYKEITNIEVEKELNTLSNELISKMKKNKFKGTYKIIENNTIEWKIQENIRIEILVDYDDVIDFYYKDPSGNEHRHDRSDDYPHSNIMELLSDYNNSKFEVKEKGLFRKKYKLFIKRRDD